MTDHDEYDETSDADIIMGEIQSFNNAASLIETMWSQRHAACCHGADVEETTDNVVNYAAELVEDMGHDHKSVMHLLIEMAELILRVAGEMVTAATDPAEKALWEAQASAVLSVDGGTLSLEGGDALVHYLLQSVFAARAADFPSKSEEIPDEVPDFVKDWLSRLQAGHARAIAHNN